MGMTPKALMAEAVKARRRAYAPYSRFPVGAALLAKDGRVFHGCNVENVSYGLTICAERNAVGAMVLGGKKPVAVAIVVDSREPTPPCGMCRQALAEFEPDLAVLGVTPDGARERWSLSDLLPGAFRSAALEEGQGE